MTDKNRTIHQFRNIKRFREMLGIKKEAMAHELGAAWSHKKSPSLTFFDIPIAQAIPKPNFLLPFQ